MKMTNVESGSGKLDIRAVVLTADKFEDMELFVPYFRLLEAGARVDIAAPSRAEIGGENGSQLPLICSSTMSIPMHMTSSSFRADSLTVLPPRCGLWRRPRRSLGRSLPRTSPWHRSATGPGCSSQRIWSGAAI